MEWVADELADECCPCGETIEWKRDSSSFERDGYCPACDAEYGAYPAAWVIVRCD